ncbi:E2F-associated phosphoprotein-like [Mizuhopecten yessoensis]|uniref:E2F-associated phosphoprotein n=1 Tax=Mizuhopecten yessoensis TaxID=6573 RepID=A0A210R718_MIZYE|nr:E2F-associated phosphoprotein-like [Mizuhopecten yessoensis]OWF56843.1 E2F-associated phosphoprotein [Mizuhopecten yessoensis]
MDIDNDYIDFGDDSDPCVGSDSSSDEGGLDIVLNGTPELKRKLTVRCSKKPELSSEDEFEKEMNEELNDTVKAIEAERCGQKFKTGKKVQCQGESSKSSKAVKGQERHYDDVYFDSDEEEMVTQGDERVKKKTVISNDDLLYDPDMDDQDQEWVDKRRHQYQPGTSGTQKVQRRLPRSDAVLDCPACMSTLCRDCQRHTSFENQYRAMFVMNCAVDKSELLKYPEQQPKISKKKLKKLKRSGNSFSGSATGAEVTGLEAGLVDTGLETRMDAVGNQETDTETSKDIFNPVRCTECNTVVGVYDQDEVYHFFNVLASYT